MRQSDRVRTIPPAGEDREQGSPSSTRLPRTPPPSAEPSPFPDVQTAVRFGLAYSRAPSSSQVWTTGSAHAHDAASGADALAQAGMVVAALAALGQSTIALLSARVLPRTLVCGCGQPCCKGRRPNFEWQRAIETVAREGFGELRIRAHPSLARAIVSRAYDRGPSDAVIATKFMVDVDVVTQGAREFRRWLVGSRDAPGAEPRAWARADARLRELGVLTSD